MSLRFLIVTEQYNYGSHSRPKLAAVGVHLVEISLKCLAPTVVVVTTCRRSPEAISAALVGLLGRARHLHRGSETLRLRTVADVLDVGKRTRGRLRFPAVQMLRAKERQSGLSAYSVEAIGGYNDQSNGLFVDTYSHW